MSTVSILMAPAPSDLLLQFLRRSALFARLSTEDCSAVLARMRPAQFASGTLIFSRGDPSSGLYLIRSGSVRLSVLTSDGRELALSHASEGAVFGEIATLDGGERTADATALTDVNALMLPRAALKSVIETRPGVADAAILFLCSRLRETDQTLEAIALHPIEVRLARFLLSAVEATDPGRSSGTVAVTPGISQSEIGLLIGASRPKVNAALSLLESQRAFRRDGSIIHCDVALLLRFAAYDRA